MRELQMSKLEPIERLGIFFSRRNIANTDTAPVRARLRESISKKGTTLTKEAQKRTHPLTKLAYSPAD
jgi:hypothetical protein